MSNMSCRASLLLVATASLALVLRVRRLQQDHRDGHREEVDLRGRPRAGGPDPDSVACPTEPRTAKPNDEFECVVVPKEGGKLTVKVTQKDDQGNINWSVAKTEGLLDLSKVEESVKQGLKAQANADATVTCGGRWKGAKKGDTFDCEAKTAAGETVTIMVNVSDDNGNIEWGTK